MQDKEYQLLLKRARGAYLGLAVGDALGATVEFMTAREIVTNLGRHTEMTGGGWLYLRPGQVTDDTTMSLALGESILDSGSVQARSAADAFDQWLKSRPVDIGNTVRRGIVSYRNSGTTEMPENYYDAGNGACMRSLPVALATYGQEPESVTCASRLQAHITHNNPVSDAGCECVINIIQMFLSGADSREVTMLPVQELLNAFPEYSFEKHIDNPSGYIVETLQAVFQAFFSADSFEECLVNVVNRGGDADTTGAIAGMIAGSYYGEDSIPGRWLEVLDSDIRTRCEQQAEALLLQALSAKELAQHGNNHVLGVQG